MPSHYNIDSGPYALLQEIKRTAPYKKTKLDQIIDIKLIYKYVKAEDKERKRLTAEIE